MATGLDGRPETSREAAPGADSPSALLDAAVDQAVALFHDGKPDESVRALRSVRRRAERLGPERANIAVVARTWLSESAAVFDMSGDLHEALEMLEHADRLAVRVADPALLARVRGQRALVVLRSGDTRAALTAFDQAAQLIDDAAPLDRAIIMLNRGVLHLERSDLVRAASDLERSVSLAEGAEDPRLAAMARHNLGYVDFLAGRIPRALAAFQEAARTIPGDPHPAMRLDHARALREAGLAPDADAILLANAERVTAARLLQDLGETELVRAEVALEERDPHRARALARSARRRFIRRGNLRWQRKAELLELRCERAAADSRGDRGRRTALTSLSERADRLAEECHRELRPDLARAADLIAAECRLRVGEPASAPRMRPVDPLPTRLQVRAVRTLRATYDGDETRALREVRRGLEELGSFQSGLGSLDLRTAGAVHGVALTRLGLDITVDRGSAAGVLEMVERSRAISTRLPRLHPPRDERTALLLGELRHVEEEARSLEGDAEAAAMAARLRTRAASLQRDIRARAWELEGDETATMQAAPRLSHVRAAAREDGSAFVSFARHRGGWLAVVVTAGGAHLTALAPVDRVAELVRRVRADLDALAKPHLPNRLAETIRGSVHTDLRHLDDLLLAPLGVAGRPLVLSCSGPLAVLPWSLLPSRSKLPTVVTPGAGTWLRSRTAPRPERPHVAVLAGPGLHESEKEARDVAATWPGAELVVGDGATTSAARSALAHADLLHVAAHGTHRQDNPLFSSVRLADGPLYAYELDPEDGVPTCVTLSACEAGLATLRPGDEGLGLTHVLLHLGVASVVAGVARVRDDVAAHTMTLVHKEMASGATSAEGLATALAQTVDAPAPAPFVTFGSPW